MGSFLEGHSISYFFARQPNGCIIISAMSRLGVSPVGDSAAMDDSVI